MYYFGEVCLLVIPIAILGNLFYRAILRSVANHWKDENHYSGIQLMKVLSYVFCIGTIVHEVGHRLFCLIFGVEVRETRYFYAHHERTKKDAITTDRVKIGGHVTPKGEIHSVLVAMNIGIAPLIINGLLIALIYYYWPMLVANSLDWLAIYGAIALALGVKPSSGDLNYIYHTFKRNPGRNFAEILIFLTYCGVIAALVAFQIETWIILTIIVLTFFAAVSISRVRGKMKSARFTQRI